MSNNRDTSAVEGVCSREQGNTRTQGDSHTNKGHYTKGLTKKEKNAQQSTDEMLSSTMTKTQLKNNHDRMRVAIDLNPRPAGLTGREEQANVVTVRPTWMKGARKYEVSRTV